MGEERRIHSANKRGWKLVDSAQVVKQLAHTPLPKSVHYEAEAALKHAGHKPAVTPDSLFGEAIRKAAKI